MAFLIVTPTLGRSPHFAATRRSVEALAASGVEVIHAIVGPASLNLPELDGQSGKSRLEMRIIEERPETRGLYEAINHAMDCLAGAAWTHFTYINDDDCLGVEFSRGLRRHLEWTPGAFGYGRVRLIDESGESLGRVPIETRPRNFESLLAQGISPLNQQGMIVPRSLWESLGGFRPQYRLAADLDFWLRAHRKGWEFCFHPLEMGEFRINPGQLSADTARLAAEIRAVYEACRPKAVSPLEAKLAKWRFRTINANVYLQRLFRRKSLSGMKMLAGR